MSLSPFRFRVKPPLRRLGGPGCTTSEVATMQSIALLHAFNRCRDPAQTRGRRVNTSQCRVESLAKARPVHAVASRNGTGGRLPHSRCHKVIREHCKCRRKTRPADDRNTLERWMQQASANCRDAALKAALLGAKKSPRKRPEARFSRALILPRRDLNPD